MLCSLLLLLLRSVTSQVPDACETMQPSHAGVPQSGLPPYTFYLNKPLVLSRLSAHFAIKTTGVSRSTFSAFMVQARDDATDLPVGQFDPGCLDIQVMSCFGSYAVGSIIFSIGSAVQQKYIKEQCCVFVENRVYRPNLLLTTRWYVTGEVLRRGVQNWVRTTPWV